MDIGLESRREVMHAREGLALLYDAQSHLRIIHAALTKPDDDFRVRMEITKGFQLAIDALSKASEHLNYSRTAAIGVEHTAKLIYARADEFKPRVFKLIEPAIINGLGHISNHDTLILLSKEEAQVLQKQISALQEDTDLTRRALYKRAADHSIARIQSYIHDTNTQLISPVAKLFETAFKMGISLPDLDAEVNKQNQQSLPKELPKVQSEGRDVPPPKDELPFFPEEAPPPEKKNFLSKLFP